MLRAFFFFEKRSQKISQNAYLELRGIVFFFLLGKDDSDDDSDDDEEDKESAEKGERRGKQKKQKKQKDAPRRRRGRGDDDAK